jgi:hypothetical protein
MIKQLAKRFQTYFGIPLPPWRKKPLGAGAVTIRFVIQGTIPSKKNNQQAICVRKDAYKLIKELASQQNGHITKSQAFGAIKKVYGKMRGNEAYNAFLKQQKPLLQAQAQVWSQRLQAKGLIFPLTAASMNLRFYFAHRYRQDSVNKQQAVQDLLKDCQIIADDDYTVLNPITAEADCYYEEITENLCFISLTFRL